MKNNDLSFLIKKHLMDKKNIIFAIILVLTILLIFIALTMINFALMSKNMVYNRNPLTRTILVNKGKKAKYDYDKINEIEHVVSNVSDKYRNSYPTKITEFNSEKLKGYLDIYPLINDDLITIIKGRKILNSHEAICPENFYPHDMYITNGVDDFTIRVYPSELFKGSKLFDKTFTIPSDNENNPDLNVKIVGTYNTKEINATLNSCYISMQDYDTILDPFVRKFDSDGNRIKEEKKEYLGRIVLVDKYANVESVIEQLQNLGFSTMTLIEVDTGFLNLLFYVPMCIGVIVIIISFGLINNFLIKKTKNRKQNYGILNSTGYTHQEIKQIEIIENLFVLLFCTVIALILYLIAYCIIDNLYLTEFRFYSLAVPIPILLFLLAVVVIGIYIYIINNKILNRHLKHTVQELLKEK